VTRRTLNDRMVKALKPPSPDVMDAVVPGLGVRVLGTKERPLRTFILVARYPGSKNPTRRSLGSYGELTIEGARKKAREWRELIDRRIDPEYKAEQERQAELRKQANSFAAVAEEFIKRHVSKTRKAAIVERELRREFITRWGDRPITDITQHDVVAVIDKVVDRGAPYQAHNLLGHVRTLFNWAIARGVYGLERSPCDRLRPGAVIGEKQARTRVLNDDEIRAFWAACEALEYPYGPLFQLLLLAGQRKSEVGEAQWREFDLAKGLWTIPATRMKADAAHVVPLSEPVRRILADLPRFKSGDFLFSTTFGKKPVAGYSKAKVRLNSLMLEKLRERATNGEATIAPFVLHDCRRTMRTGLSALPIPDLVRELVIAHTKPGLHKVYDQHAYLAEKAEALTLWAARLRDIIEPPLANVVALQAGARA
jgi:integrase